MTSWRYRLTCTALCALLLQPASAATTDSHASVSSEPAAVDQTITSAASRKLVAQTDAKLHTSSLHETAQLGMTNDSSMSSASYNMHGMQPGLPATCYGQPCNAAACYPVAKATVQRHVNYVTVNAIVKFSRRYKVSSAPALHIRLPTLLYSAYLSLHFAALLASNRSLPRCTLHI